MGGKWGATDRDIPEVWVLGVDRLRPRVVAVEPVLGLAPGLATILRASDPLAGRLVHPLGRYGVGKQLVRVAVGLGVVVDPGLSAVARAHHAAELDPNCERLRIGWVERDRADVVRPRARRKGPPRGARELAESRQQLPAESAVLGPIEVAGLGACVDDRHAGVLG